jgi:hypothetical protein
MPRGENTAFHPNRQVGAARFIQSASVSTPTPDGGISSRDAGMTIQNQWEHLRDLGMSSEDATARLHGDMSIPIPENEPRNYGPLPEHYGMYPPLVTQIINGTRETYA